MARHLAAAHYFGSEYHANDHIIYQPLLLNSRLNTPSLQILTFESRLVQTYLLPFLIIPSNNLSFFIRNHLNYLTIIQFLYF